MSTVTTVSERERAKQIIAAIIRSAGGTLTSKTELLREYWRAHLVFAESQPGYLSFWPLQKTPTGPAIKDVDRLLGELVSDGVLQIDETEAGGGLRLELTDHVAGELPAESVEAIEQAVSQPGEPVNLADYQSLRSWQEASDGEELNIYLDVIPEAEYADRKQRLQEMVARLDNGGVKRSPARGLPDDEYQRQLVAGGIMKSVKPRRRDQQAFERFQPVEITGKPLSETIIEQRR